MRPGKRVLENNTTSAMTDEYDFALPASAMVRAAQLMALKRIPSYISNEVLVGPCLQKS